MTFDEFLANIKNKFKQYDSVGLIDEMSVYEDALYAIKSLGLLVLEKNSTVVQIKNGKGKLPSGFSKLVSAIKCTPYEYECEDEPERILQSSYMSAVKDIKRTEWNGCNPCDETYSEEIIVENIYFHGKRKAHIKYNNPLYLKLATHVNKNMCEKECPNLKIKECPYEISIKGNTIYTNFKEGTIYITYKGFEEDDDGMVIIPESTMGHVEKYVNAYVSSELMFQMLANSDNTTNERTLYGELLRQVGEYKALAVTELKFKGMDRAINKYKKVIKKEFNSFNF